MPAWTSLVYSSADPLASEEAAREGSIQRAQNAKVWGLLKRGSSAKLNFSKENSNTKNDSQISPEQKINDISSTMSVDELDSGNIKNDVTLSQSLPINMEETKSQPQSLLSLALAAAKKNTDLSIPSVNQQKTKQLQEKEEMNAQENTDDNSKEILTSLVSKLKSRNTLLLNIETNVDSIKPMVQTEFSAITKVKLEPAHTFLKMPNESAKEPLSKQHRSAPWLEYAFDIFLAFRSQKLPTPIIRSMPFNIHALHSEILVLWGFLQLTPLEIQCREKVIEYSRHASKVLWPNSQLHVVGSYGTGLSLPNSDMDICISNIPDTDDETTFFQLRSRQIGTVLLASGLVKSLSFVDSARTPIIRAEFTCGIEIDIQFESVSANENPNPNRATRTTEFVNALLEDFPLARFLMLPLKLFLQQHDCSTPYTGGLGSYLLMVMVAGYLQYVNRKPSYLLLGLENCSDLKGLDPSTLSGNLGLLLLGFLKFYSDFSRPRVIINLRDEGKFVSSHSSGALPIVVSPLEPTHDLASSCRAFPRLIVRMQAAYHMILGLMMYGSTSIVGCVSGDSLLSAALINSGVLPMISLHNEAIKNERQQWIESLAGLAQQYIHTYKPPVPSIDHHEHNTMKKRQHSSHDRRDYHDSHHNNRAVSDSHYQPRNSYEQNSYQQPRYNRPPSKQMSIPHHDQHNMRYQQYQHRRNYR